MFPAQTSFIPITVALTKYIEAYGFSNNYPYWYLGSTPVRYLIGPVVPSLLVVFHKVLPSVSFFDLSIVAVLLFQFLTALGWGLLAWKLSGKRLIGVFVLVGVFILPWHWVSAFGLGEVSAILAQAMTPWVLMAYAKYQISNTKYQILLPVTAITFLLLTNTTASISAIVGLVILAISNSKDQIANIKKAALVILGGWALSMLWYGPGYYLTIFGAPSIGGKSAFGAFFGLVNFVRGLVPIILVIVLVWWRARPKNFYEKFVLGWLTIFGSMTLFRFISDFDFWMDWTSWMGEVEVGVALLAGHILSQSLVSKKRSTNLETDLEVISQSRSGPRQHHMLEEKSKVRESWLRHVFGYFEIAPQTRILILITVIYYAAGWGLAWQKRDFWLPRRSIENTVEYKVSYELASLVRPEETVFLSGSSVFWLNALFDIRQVRGGRDEVSRSAWRPMAWEVREGEDAASSYAALSGFGIDYLVVHKENSGEYYHDFPFSDKFENNSNFQKVFADSGDLIFKIKK